MSRRRAFCQFCGAKLQEDVCPNCQPTLDEELRITLKDVYAYLDYHEEVLSEASLETKRIVLGKLVRNLPKEGKITAKTISEALQKGRVSRRTLKTTYFDIVIVFFKWLLGEKHPFVEELIVYRKKLKAPEEQEKEIDPKDFEKFFLYIGENYQIFLWLVRATTARRTAACNVNLRDIVFYNRCRKCKDRAIKNETGEELCPKCKGTALFEVADITRYEKWGGEEAKKEVLVTLTSKLTKELRVILDIRRAAELSFLEEEKPRGKDAQGNDLYFIDEKGRYFCWNQLGNRIKPRSLSTHFYKKARELGITISAHGGRHLRISELAAAGVPIPVVRKISGHARGSSIIFRYIHIDQEEAAKKTLEKLEEE